jgi:hypothetical protein
VFLEEKRNNLDCSCILTSLSKICLHPRYRTIIGLENLIQKDWFLAGHLFYKRLSVPKRTRSISDDYQIQNENDRRNSLTSTMTQNDALTGTSASVTSSKNENGISPTFLLFLDCLFQLTVQYPNEFEFNEYYLINLWDYVCSGLSFTFSFNGVTDWTNYLNNLNFIDSTTTDDAYLKQMFDSNNSFWTEHLENEANRASYCRNKNFSANSEYILNPCERIYALKFWSRNYLRWHERYHAYSNSVEVEVRPLPSLVPSLVPSRPAPPPPTQKNKSEGNKSPHKHAEVDNELRNSNDSNIEELTSF